MMEWATWEQRFGKFKEAVWCRIVEGLLEE
jgi:hypothetical protein